MNIFATDLDPHVSARNLCDKHVPKMLLESCQMLCSPYPINIAPYKRSYYNHPCTIWVRLSIENYEWLLLHADGISKEYSFRFGKYHKCNKVLNWCVDNYKLLNLPSIGLTKFAMAMPDIYKNTNDPINAYRSYYKGTKGRFAKWTKGRSSPVWWP